MKFYEFILIVALFAVVNAIDPEVTTHFGTIRGRRVSVDGHDVDEYLGIPYATPPIGKLRFAKPQPITDPWNATYVAQALPNSCLQTKEQPNSEDCLYLNIYATRTDDPQTTELKPVLFWIHGGAFIMGSSKIYNGSTLALRNCVVVTINYRLSAFGFLFGNNEEIPGNVALFDQLLALKWVNENIGYFGGDKNMVTIFGESAGGWSVSLHLMSHLTRPFYKNAIIMSGMSMDYLNVDSKEWAVKRAKALANVVGCNVTQDSLSLSNEVVDCLREKDAYTILKATKDAKVTKAAQSLVSGLPFLPVFEDQFIPLSPRDIWERGDFKNGTSLLFGTVYNEYMIDFEIKNDTELREFMKWKCENFVPQQFLTKSECDDLIQIYFTGIDEDSDRPAAITAARDMFNDLIFHCPSIAFAERFSDLNPVYQYFYIYKPRKDDPSCGPKYPCHSSDVPMTFGYIRDSEDAIPTSIWVEIITDFAKTGKTFWSQYYRTELKKLVPVYYEFKGNKLQNNTHVALKSYACDIWKSAVFNRIKNS